MRDHFVFCGGLTASRNKSDSLHLDANAPIGSPSKINLRIDHISRRLAENIPDLLTDMLEVAAYVYCADQLIGLGTSQMTEMGAEWRRRFRFSIPVRCLSVWKDPRILGALCDTLGFLSEDEYAFEFVESAKPQPLQSYIPFDDSVDQSFALDEVVLFSGGLDSLAGAIDALMGAGKRLALVSHQSSTMVTSKQHGLLAALRDRTPPGSLFHIPVSINKGHSEAVEFTQRTRSFMFATLAFIVARMFGRDDLSFYENGIVSINLPVAEHVLGARASRTTHPQFLARCGRLFSLLLERDFTLSNPFLWKTKTEVVKVLEKNRQSDLISSSFSCANVRQATKLSRHCGVCSQCVDRRFGILAAELSAYEPTDHYAVDLFAGAHQSGFALTMIEGYVLRAQKLATMSQHAFTANYGQIFRAVEQLPGLPDDNVARLWDLHRRHGREVVSVVDQEIERRSSLACILDLPTNCLLSLIVSPVAKQPDHQDPAEAEPTAAEQAEADPHDYGPKRTPLAIDKQARKVVFEGGLEFGGQIYEFIELLAETFTADIDAGTFSDQHRFLRAAVLADTLGIDEPSLRKRISRARKKLTAGLLDKLNRQLLPDDIIENQEWKGYRLNPYLLLVNPSQLRRPPSNLSHLSSQMVTSPGVGH
jgi:7-cyano-7-deazaguanine synthase in queuosine biosynthesis